MSQGPRHPFPTLQHGNMPHPMDGISLNDISYPFLPMNDRSSQSSQSLGSLQLNMTLPQYVEPNVHIQPPPSFRGWFNSSGIQSDSFQKSNDFASNYLERQPMQQHAQYMVGSASNMDVQRSIAFVNSNLDQARGSVNTMSASVLGKREKPETDIRESSSEGSKKKDLVFKGFTMEPDSKRIKFVNSDRKVDGINGK